MNFPEPVIIGASPPIKKVLQITRKVSDLDLNVLITGESGVGKELIARSLHYHSRRKDSPFVKVNSAALPSELLESELFGFEKGAFTGADQAKTGKFELAGKGSIFLDEIGELPFFMQSKLLQIIQDREYYRVGGHKPLEVKARIIAATNLDLDPENSPESFRRDLFYRLSTISIHIPPLRERKEDIIPLVEYFNDYLHQEKKLPKTEIPEDLMEIFKEYHWPGNVRELINYLQRYSVFSDSQEIKKTIWANQGKTAKQDNRDSSQASRDKKDFDLDQDFLNQNTLDTNNFPSLREVRNRVVKQVEKNIIENVLRETNWNRKEASRILKISYRALLYKIKELKVNK